MDAKTINISKFLASNIQLKTPIYQKEYSWSLKECEILLDDLLNIGFNSNISSYFIGTILLSNQENSNIVDKFQIIDGQQRITTLMLVVIALASYLKKNIASYYLINNKENGNDKYKLLLNGNDKDTLIKIINMLESNSNLIFSNEDSQNIIQNYLYFKNNINDDNFKRIYEGFKKLTAVCINLNEDENPQLVYDTLNAPNLKLSTAELIRNYILFNLPVNKQEELYEKYWYYLDKEFEIDSGYFDEFIRYYLTIKLKRVSDIENIYTDFKNYADSLDKENLIKDIFKYGQEFFNFKVDKKEENLFEIEGIRNPIDLEKHFKKINYNSKSFRHFKFFKEGNIAKTFFDALYEYVFSLNDSIYVKFMKTDISFRLENRSFVNMIAYSRKLSLILNMPYNMIDDPKHMCEDMSTKGHWGNGDIRFKINSIDDIDYAKYLIKQAYDYSINLI